MSRKSDTKTINGTEYRVTRFPATLAFKYKFRLAKLFAPALGALTGGKTINLSDTLDIGAALATLGESMEPDEFLKFTLQLLAETSYIDSEKESEGHIMLTEKTFEWAFGGKLMDVYKVLTFVVEVNFPDFLAKARIGLGKIQAGTSIQKNEDSKV